MFVFRPSNSDSHSGKIFAALQVGANALHTIVAPMSTFGPKTHLGSVKVKVIVDDNNALSWDLRKTEMEGRQKIE